MKILISIAGSITVALQPDDGFAWHRFLAFFNIWFKRHADGRTSLGALQPIAVGGEPVDFENIDELDEDAALGVGKVEDFTWKGLLDFNTCTECGRCQSQCPAWNTDKPLSPKLLIMGLRDTPAPRRRTSRRSRTRPTSLRRTASRCRLPSRRRGPRRALRERRWNVRWSPTPDTRGRGR